MKKVVLAGAFIGTLLATVRLPVVTYYRDVLPILQQHCLACHRPAQIAPMSFVTYGETRPWAEAIKHMVVTARMPPWSAGSPVSFGENHSLAGSELATIVQWVEGGALAGDPRDAPPPVYPEEAPRRHTPTASKP